uniref:Uncharacterized protein n=1 Tax=Rhizophora mucronata TaxID=61149 RepID=A0A2P2KBC8_RHIMU
MLLALLLISMSNMPVTYFVALSFIYNLCNPQLLDTCMRQNALSRENTSYKQNLLLNF